MTLKEFFRKARAGRRKWRVKGETVRCARGWCPLGAVMKYRGETINPDYYDAAEKLGLHPATARKIADAADWPDNKHRPWLLKNLGIS